MNFLKYLSSGINQTKNSLDWEKNLNLIAYAANNQVLIYCIKNKKVIGVSSEGHKTFINSVHWAACDGFKNFKKYLVTTDINGYIKLWQFTSTKFSDEISILLFPILSIEGHKGSITKGYSTFLSENEIFLVTTADDFCIKGYSLNIDSASIEEKFCRSLPQRSLVLDLIVIPAIRNRKKIHPIIVYGGDDSRLHILASKDGCDYFECSVLVAHQDWVTCLTYMWQDDDLILCSGSKDGFIRLWRLSVQKSTKDQIGNLEVKNIEIKIPIKNEIHLTEICFSSNEANIVLNCSLESVLEGHSGMVSSLDYCVSKNGEARILSSSITGDRSVIVWSLRNNSSLPSEKEELIWVEIARLGEVGGLREGFFNAKFVGDESIVGTSYHGGFHLWTRKIDESWVAEPVASGHFNEVVDIDWDVDSNFLLSVSKDQTTRLHAICDKIDDRREIIQEIARPQVHGYDMSCVACLPGLKFVSSAEEKVIRAFGTTRDFATRLSALSSKFKSEDVEKIWVSPKASIPSLGLSNKEESDASEVFIINPKDQESSSASVLPTEDLLMLGTLWPELTKLYGHGNEIMTLCASHDASLIASSCRAANPTDAQIIIWKTDKWKEMVRLSFHRLTVTQVEFSSCDRFLLSVSRDRSWAVYERIFCDGDASFQLKYNSTSMKKSLQHTRIIWSCCWIPQSFAFVTGSRDKTVSLWDTEEYINNLSKENDVNNLSRQDNVNSLSSQKDVNNEMWQRKLLLNENDEVTAVAASRHPAENDYAVLAIGFTSGFMSIRLIDVKNWSEVTKIDLNIFHKKTVRRIKFKKPTNDEKTFNKTSELRFTFASCGNDNAVMIHSTSFLD